VADRARVRAIERRRQASSEDTQPPLRLPALRGEASRRGLLASYRALPAAAVEVTMDESERRPVRIVQCPRCGIELHFTIEPPPSVICECGAMVSTETSDGERSQT
jgi:hypothetical protein